MTISELGQLVKAKYPQYTKMSDEEVGRLVVEKYPTYAAWVDGDVVSESFLSSNPYLEGQVKDLQEYSNTSRGRATSWWQRGKSESRTKLDSQLQSEISSKTNLENAANSSKISHLSSLHELHQTPNRLRRKAHLELLADENMRLRLVEANNRKVTLLKLEQMIEAEHETGEALRLEAGKSDIELQKTKALNEHGVRMDFERVMNTLVAITKYNHLKYDAFDEVRGRLIALMEEAHQIELSNKDPYLKAEIMGQVQQAIAAYQEVFDAFRRELVESGNGQETRQIASITDLTGGGESGNPSTPFKIQAPKSGNGD